MFTTILRFTPTIAHEYLSISYSSFKRKRHACSFYTTAPSSYVSSTSVMSIGFEYLYLFEELYVCLSLLNIATLVSLEVGSVNRMLRSTMYSNIVERCVVVRIFQLGTRRRSPSWTLHFETKPPRICLCIRATFLLYEIYLFATSVFSLHYLSYTNPSNHLRRSTLPMGCSELLSQSFLR